MSRTERLPLAMEHALLGFLSEQPMHGYEIYQHLTDPAGLWLVWRVKQSQLYALLSKLEAEGCITSSVQAQETRPPRKVFRLTRTGRQRFLAWVRSPVPHGRELRQDFFGKLYFALRAEPDTAAALIADQRAACQAWLAELRAQRPGGTARESEFQSFVREFRIGQIEAMLTWLQRSERRLQAVAAGVR